ncbi:hypothetical protein V6N13_031706 [Hibiscus sabdariffa]
MALRFDGAEAELGIVAKNIGDHIFRYFPQAGAALLLLESDYTCCFASYGRSFLFCDFVFCSLVKLMEYVSIVLEMDPIWDKGVWGRDFDRKNSKGTNVPVLANCRFRRH